MTKPSMPENEAPERRKLLALLTETLASAARKGILPLRARFEALSACRNALHGLPPAHSVAAFRAAAKDALAMTTRTISL